MKLSKLIQFATAGLSLAVVLGGCGTSSDGTPGTGGSSATGTGGSSSGSAGTTGTGGSATAGTTGNGGSSSGGSTGTGGSANGGVTGTAGVSGTAGAGGVSGTGGGAGGVTGTAGVTGTGGVSGTGGGAGGANGGRGGTSAGGGRGGSSAGSGGSGSGGSGSGTMTLTSPDQADGAKFGTMFTCAMNNGAFGSGVIPELNWANVPAGTTNFALTFIDTKIGADNAMGQHWAAWSIPAAAHQIPKATTTFTGDLAGTKQTNKYLAPCPSGNDTYEFTLYALSATLSVTGAEGTGTSNSAGVAKVLAALKGVTPLGTAILHGTSGPMGK